MKHRYWMLKGWKDMAHCMCCPCKNGAYPIGATKIEQVYKGRKSLGRYCRYGQTCGWYSETRLFFIELSGRFVARTKEDYNRWQAFRANTG